MISFSYSFRENVNYVTAFKIVLFWNLYIIQKWCRINSMRLIIIQTLKWIFTTFFWTKSRLRVKLVNSMWYLCNNYVTTIIFLYVTILSSWGASSNVIVNYSNSLSISELHLFKINLLLRIKSTDERVLDPDVMKYTGWCVIGHALLEHLFSNR